MLHILDNFMKISFPQGLPDTAGHASIACPAWVTEHHWDGWTGGRWRGATHTGCSLPQHWPAGEKYFHIVIRWWVICALVCFPTSQFYFWFLHTHTHTLCPHPQNGVLLRTVLDGVTGDMSDTRTRYLGSRPVKLFRIIMQGNESVSSLTFHSSLSCYGVSGHCRWPLINL